MLWRAFDKTVRRKPLAFAADAVYGNSIDLELEVVARKGVARKALLLMFVNVLLLAFTPMIVRRGSSSFKRRYACTHTRGSVRRVSGFVLTGKQEVIRPGRKLVLPFYERWMGIIGKIRVSPPQNLLMNGEVNQPSWLRIQSVNRVFGLTLTINLIDCPGDAIRIQTGCRWSSNMTSRVILMLSELRSKDQKPPRCVVRAWAG